MPDKPASPQLEVILAKLGKEWQELAALLQSREPGAAIEVEKILLRDGAGQYRGQIGVNQDGSIGLLLRDQEGRAWASLGINQDGEAFLELKNRQGETTFKLPVAAASPGEDVGLAPGPPADSPASPADSPPPSAPEAAIDPLPAGVGEPGASPTASPGEPPGGDLEVLLSDRLEKLARQQRRQWVYRWLTLVLLGLVLAAQGVLLFRPGPTGPLEVQSLQVRDSNGALGASLGQEGGQVGLNLWDRQGKRRAALGLAPDGSPGLALYDQDRRLRVRLNLGPDGNPQFTMRDILSPRGPTGPKSPDDPGKPLPAPGTGHGPEAGAPPGPQAGVPAGPAPAAAPEPQAAAQVVYVGSRTSNKYHYPTCKWAKTIRPEKLIKFKSVAEAQARHYIPCPVCKPPPLSN